MVQLTSRRSERGNFCVAKTCCGKAGASGEGTAPGSWPTRAGTNGPAAKYGLYPEPTAGTPVRYGFDACNRFHRSSQTLQS